MIVLRKVLGAELRRRRLLQRRTLQDVAAAAVVSFGYLSEIERGHKEVSSECLAAICDALGCSMAGLLASVAHEIALIESATVIALPTARGTEAAA